MCGSSYLQNIISSKIKNKDWSDLFVIFHSDMHSTGEEVLSPAMRPVLCLCVFGAAGDCCGVTEHFVQLCAVQTKVAFRHITSSLVNIHKRIPHFKHFPLKERRKIK